MLEKTHFDVSGDRFAVTYKITGDDAVKRAEQLAVEQTIEFPAHLVPDDSIREHIIGQVESTSPAAADTTFAKVTYAAESSAYALPQLLNVVFGNTSLQPGIRVIDIELPTSVLSHFRGPRFGRDGLRERVGEPRYPLFCTALKPMGLDPRRLAEQAAEYAEGGFHFVKDDHGLADQPMAPLRERVPPILQAIDNTNARTGGNTLYIPSMNSPAERLEEDVRWVVEQGAGGLMFLPGFCGLDAMRRFAEDDDIALPILAHPAMLGSFVTAADNGIGHGVLFGTLMRLAAADATIYPNFGGRFSFSERACVDIANASASELGHIKPIFPSPGGGMRFDNVPDMIRVYGADVMFLIGGALHDGEEGVTARCRMLIDSVRQAVDARSDWQ